MAFPGDRLAFAAVSALVIGLVVGALIGQGGVARHGPLRQELRNLEAEVENLVRANRALAREIEALRSDPEFMESVARDELGWVRPGERVVVFDE
jgi:cell division protein FtsB